MFDPAADVGFELGDAAVDASAKQAGAQFGEESFDEVEPGAAGRGEVQVEAGVADEPAVDLRGLVGTSLVKSIFVRGCRLGAGGPEK